MLSRSLTADGSRISSYLHPPSLLRSHPLSAGSILTQGSSEGFVGSVLFFLKCSRAFANLLIYSEIPSEYVHAHINSDISPPPPCPSFPLVPYFAGYPLDLAAPPFPHPFVRQAGRLLEEIMRFVGISIGIICTAELAGFHSEPFELHSF